MGWGRAAGVCALIALISLVSGCAPEAVAGWHPQASPMAPGARLVSSSAAPDASPPASAAVDQSGPGLTGMRLRNDALPIAARFAYVPGVPAFNTKVNELVQAAIRSTGIAYTPQAHPVEAGLDERGCVAGSTLWPATEVLARPETGPAGGAGTAITCEVTATFGNTIAMNLRVVTGGPAGVTGDTQTVLEADVATGQVVTGRQRWSDAAPAMLWALAIDVLRDEAGALSSAAPAAPSEAQLALAGAALNSATMQPDGTVRVTMPAGVTSPELDGLGVLPSTEAMAIELTPETAERLSSDAWNDEQTLLGTPFTGVRAPQTSVSIDCALIPCVALTYDDGPSAYTPQLLDTLANEQALATFFLIGGAVPGGADSVARMADAGHALGSHTMTHADLTMLSASAVHAQVQGAANAIQQVTGVPVTMFRPPYGAVNNAVIQAAGMPAILWSVDTNDWREPGQQALFDRSVPVVSPGGIILFHDTHADSVAAAGTIIQGLRTRGFEPVTVPQLFGGEVPAGRVSQR